MSRTTTRRGMSIAVVLVGVFVSSLDLLIVNIAFPELERSFASSSLRDLSWVLSAYAITFAALLMPAGRWADRSGRKRLFLSGLALFTVASALCAAAPSLGMLVAARVLQAIGAALMLPSSLGLLLPLFPPERRGSAIGLWSAIAGAAGAAGPPIGGVLVQAGWGWVFLVNVPIGVLTLLIGGRTLQETRDEVRSVSDILGATVFAVVVAAIVAAIVQGQDWGWGSLRIVGLIVLGALGVVFSVRRIFHHSAPFIEPAILRHRAVAVANLAAMVFFSGFGAMILASTLFLTGIWQHSALRTGVEIMPGPVTAAVFAVFGARLAARHGARSVGFVGSVLFAAGGIWWAAGLSSSSHYVSSFLLPSIVGGIGAGFVLPTLSAAATLPLPPERYATGTAMLSMCRQVGLAIGVAVVASVLDVRPDVPAFRTTWLFMAASGFASGLILLATGVERRPVREFANARSS